MLVTCLDVDIWAFPALWEFHDVISMFRPWLNTHAVISIYRYHYFPEVAERLKNKIHLTPNLTTMITGHGNIKTNLHKFKLIDSPNCPCGHNDQTTDHVLFKCTLLNEERERLISAVSRTDDWPPHKHTRIRKHYKAFTRFTNQISFDRLNSWLGITPTPIRSHK
jgi:hypothetical protein